MSIDILFRMVHTHAYESNNNKHNLNKILDRKTIIF